MEFNEQLNEYIGRLNCSSKRLADSTGLSAAVISRYRKGERMPSAESEQLFSLARGIAAIAKAEGISGLSEEKVTRTFSAILDKKTNECKRLSDNLNKMIAALGISVTQMARFMNYDASFLSKIRSGERRPANIGAFTEEVCSFIVHNYADDDTKTLLSNLMGCPLGQLSDDYAMFTAIKGWLCTGTQKSELDPTGVFLEKLDEFDLNEYISAIKFDELKVPSAPFQLSTSKNYYGMEAMKQGELDFFKSTVLSKSAEPVFMCSDMPMEEMAEDMVFGKKWMFGLAMMLKKGMHLHIIHNLDRPFQEMMLGLESWIPMYMTGQVSPYYLKGVQNSVYCHLHYVSGQAALIGDCVSGFHAGGKYYLTRNRQEVAYYREKTEYLLKKARPLMDIYRGDSANLYDAFLLDDAKEKGTRRSILSSLPIYTISRALLEKILTTNRVDVADKQEILKFVEKQKENAARILEHSVIKEEVPVFSREEFEKSPMLLSLSGAFYEANILYSFEDYLTHLAQTRAFAASHTNYLLKESSAHTFRNIQIMVREGKWVMLSKNNHPTVHFVIQHPKLRNALENMILPVQEA